MRCIGRTKKLTRCKKKCKFLFCNSHKLQWWGIIVIIATLGGLFQDVIRPLFTKEELKTEELIGLLNHRKQILDTLYTQISFEIDIVSQDTSFSKWKTDLVNYKSRLEKAKKELDILSQKNIKALRKNQLIKSHELEAEIHQISKKYKLNELGTLITPNEIEALKEIIVKTEEFVRIACISHAESCFLSLEERNEYISKLLIKNKILELYDKRVSVSEIDEILVNYGYNPARYRNYKPIEFINRPIGDPILIPDSIFWEFENLTLEKSEN